MDIWKILGKVWVYEIFSSGVVVGSWKVGWVVKCEIPGVKTAEIWDRFFDQICSRNVSKIFV